MSPTPTIEGLDEIFETLVHGLNNNPDTSNYIGADGEDWGHIRNAKAALILLITKAEQNARLDELTYVHIRDGMLYTSAPDDGADHTINDRIAQLKELTQ